MARTQVGVDIEDVSRFKLDRAEHALFLKRVFSQTEIEYCYSKKNPAPHLAARFAAKEALIKALGIRHPDHSTIEVVKEKDGSPKMLIDQHEIEIALSISHTKNNAVACIMIAR